MTQIIKTVDKEKKLAKFSIYGELGPDQLIHEINQFYTHDFTLNTFWDLSNADMSLFDANQVERVIEHSKQYLNLRNGGKSAFVLPSDLGYGMGRMYDIISKLENSPVLYQVFRNTDEALNWLGEQ